MSSPFPRSQAAAVAASVWFRDLPHSASTDAAVRDAVIRKLRAAAEVGGGAGAVVTVRSTNAAPGGGTQVVATVTLPRAGQAVSPRSVAASLAVRLDREAAVVFAADATLGTLGQTPGRVQDRWVALHAFRRVSELRVSGSDQVQMDPLRASLAHAVSERANVLCM